MPTLTIQLPGKRPVDHLWRTEVITLGRAPENTIALDDASVSQSHARINHSGNDYFLKDLGSTNGTQLNGRIISEACLYDGDELKLGDVLLKFRLAPDNGPAPSPAVIPDEVKATTAILPPKRETTLLKTVATAPLPAPAKPQFTPHKRSAATLIAAGIGVLAGLGFLAVLLWKPAAPEPVQAASDITSKPPPAAVGSNPDTNTLPPATPQPTNTMVDVPEAEPAVEMNLPAATPPEATPAQTPDTNAPPAPVAQANTNTVADLLVALRSRDVAERRRAAQAIGEAGVLPKDATMNLRIALLQDSDLETRAWLVAALAGNQTFDQASVPLLLGALHHNNTALRLKACATLASFPLDEANKAGAIAALNTSLNDASEDVRKAAAAALKAISPDAK